MYYGSLGMAPHGSALRRRSERASMESEDGADDASLRSMARTSMERNSERSSNDTIVSFLDDHMDVHASGDFSFATLRDFRLEPPSTSHAMGRREARAELKAELDGGGGATSTSPRGRDRAASWPVRVQKADKLVDKLAMHGKAPAGTAERKKREEQHPSLHHPGGALADA